MHLQVYDYIDQRFLFDIAKILRKDNDTWNPDTRFCKSENFYSVKNILRMNSFFKKLVIIPHIDLRLWNNSRVNPI